MKILYILVTIAIVTTDGIVSNVLKFYIYIVMIVVNTMIIILIIHTKIVTPFSPYIPLTYPTISCLY